MTGRQDLFQQAMNQGHSAAWDQLWDRAADYYRQALDEFPDHPQALTSLGLALYELQDYEESLRAYQHAARAAAEDPLPLEKIGQLYERIGNLEQALQSSLRAAELYLKNRDVNKAIENWLRVTRLNPEHLHAHSRLALVYERTGEKEKAVNEYLAVASLLQSAGDREKAARSIQQALQILPNNEASIQALLLLKESRPLPKPARPRGGTAPLRMAQVRQLQAPRADDQADAHGDPVSQARQRALTMLAGMLFDASEDGKEDTGPRRGLQSIMRGTTGSLSLGRQVDRTRILLHLSQVVDLQTRGQDDQAAAELDKAIEAGLDHACAYFDLGYLHAQTNRLESALRLVQMASKHADFTLATRLLSADILVRMGRVQQAALEYLEALKIADAQMVEPEDADDLRQLYEPLIEANRHENDPEAQARLCETIHDLLMQPDWRSSLARARTQLPAREPNSPPIPLAEIITAARSSQVIEMISKIYELANRGQLRAAGEEAFFALQHAPTYLPLHTYVGELLLKQGRVQDAINKFTVVARAYSIRGEVPRAIELYRRILIHSPVDMNARTRLIDMLISSGAVEEAIQEHMDLADIYYSLADLEMVRKTYTEALRLAQKSKIDRSLRVQILHRMADIDLQSLDWRQALRIFEQIRTLQPEDEKSRSSLIELNFRLGQEPQALAELDNYIAYLISVSRRNKAITFIEDLLTENPERISVRRRLAELLRQAGRKDDAIREFDAIGDACMEAGDRNGAVQAIESILALNPNNKDDYHRLLLQVQGRL